jgi:hypothetical protein
MTGMERDWVEAELRWRRTDRMEDRLDLVERALAGLSGRLDERNVDRFSNDGGSNERGR